MTTLHVVIQNPYNPEAWGSDIIDNILIYDPEEIHVFPENIQRYCRFFRPGYAYIVIKIQTDKDPHDFMMFLGEKFNQFSGGYSVRQILSTSIISSADVAKKIIDAMITLSALS